jgi:hypothetical protein
VSRRYWSVWQEAIVWIVNKIGLTYLISTFRENWAMLTNRPSYYIRHNKLFIMMARKVAFNTPPTLTSTLTTYLLQLWKCDNRGPCLWNGAELRNQMPATERNSFRSPGRNLIPRGPRGSKLDREVNFTVELLRRFCSILFRNYKLRVIIRDKFKLCLYRPNGLETKTWR